MNCEWTDAYCLAKPGAVKDYQQDWKAVRYLLDGKMFMMQGTDGCGKPLITVKLEPEYGQLLREEFPGVVVAGYYMNKLHWNSVYTETGVPDEVLRDLLDRSYALILASLSKKRRAGIAAM